MKKIQDRLETKKDSQESLNTKQKKIKDKKFDPNPPPHKNQMVFP